MFDRKMYQDTFAQVHASEETLSEVLNMTRKKNQFSGVRLTRMLVAAVIIAGVLATTAFAYVGFTRYENPMVMLKSFFGAEEYSVDEGTMFTYQDEYYYNEYQTPTVEHVPLDEDVAEDVAQYVSDVGKSITYGNDTLTVEAHLYDSATECGVIYYTIENPNGISGYDVSENGEVWWPDGEPVFISDVGNGKGQYIIEEETTRTKVAIAFYYCGAVDLDYIRVAFYDDKSNALILPMDDGGGMEYLSFANGDIKLSPIAIRICGANMDFLYSNRDIYCDIREFVIRYEDGTEFVVYSQEPYVDNTTYALNSYDGTVISYTFNRLVDLEKVEALVINNVEIPVSE